MLEISTLVYMVEYYCFFSVNLLFLALFLFRKKTISKLFSWFCCCFLCTALFCIFKSWNKNYYSELWLIKEVCLIKLFLCIIKRILLLNSYTTLCLIIRKVTFFLCNIRCIFLCNYLFIHCLIVHSIANFTTFIEVIILFLFRLVESHEHSKDIWPRLKLTWNLYTVNVFQKKSL